MIQSSIKTRADADEWVRGWDRGKTGEPAEETSPAYAQGYEYGQRIYLSSFRFKQLLDKLEAEQARLGMEAA